jgi:hypothetical protein
MMGEWGLAADQSLTLPRAIRHLYSVFSRYESTGLIQSVYEREVSMRLQHADLRSIPVEEIRNYLSSAMATWGGVTDFKHFLPRVLELNYLAPAGHELWAVVERLQDANWTTWPPKERQALRDYFEIYWRQWLSARPDRFSFMEQPTDGLLLAIDHLLGNIAEMLAYWDESRTEEADLHLAMLVAWGATDLYGAFGETPESCLQLLRWVCGPANRVRLEAAFFSAKDEATQELFSDATTYHAALCDQLRTITEE